MFNIITHLKGSAESWYRLNIERWTDFDKFKTDFENKYWSVQKQMGFSNDLLGKRQFFAGRVDMTTYVMQYYNINNYLDHPFDLRTFLGFRP